MCDPAGFYRCVYCRRGIVLFFAWPMLTQCMLPTWNSFSKKPLSLKSEYLVEIQEYFMIDLSRNEEMTIIQS